MTEINNRNLFDNNDESNSTNSVDLENSPVESNSTNSVDLENPSVESPKIVKEKKKFKAEELATKQREISISEFFAKNKQLLGFDSPVRALMTTVKEAVDNALDACEEAHILPIILIEIIPIGEERVCVAVQDNGPGIVRKQVPKIFGQLLYGSKFHRLKQSRGQQGIGISAAGMYGQITTGRPVRITSTIGEGEPAHHFQLVIDLKKNRPKIIKDIVVEWDEEHGTRIELDIQGVYKSGRHSVDEYLAQTAISNPHAEIFYRNPKGEEFHFERVTEKLPREPKEIRPHPHGVELGTLLKICRESTHRRISQVLMNEFSRVTPNVAEKICTAADVSLKRSPHQITIEEIEKIHKAIKTVKIMAPSVSSIVPIGEKLLKRGLARQIKEAEFYISKTRPPKVYRGNPFIVEVALAYGGMLQGLYDHGENDEVSIAGIVLDETKTIMAALLDLPGFTRKKVSNLLEKTDIGKRKRVKTLTSDEIEHLRHSYDDFVKKESSSSPAQIIRVANRVPLLYQLKACAISKAVMDINWRRYGITQPRGGFPQGPLVIMVHVASVWVPFTSESKEAIAHYPEITEEIRRALQECSRELGNYLNKKRKMKSAIERKSIFKRYSGELARALSKITQKEVTGIEELILNVTEKYTVNKFETVSPDLDLHNDLQMVKINSVEDLGEKIVTSEENSKIDEKIENNNIISMTENNEKIEE
jgi:DNA topoisomerase VI subunit B